MRQRFEKFVTPEPNTGCWLWAGATTKAGYGQFGVGSKVIYAHRLALELAGQVIPDGMCVCHRCDTPACVNPEHLFVGSHADNARDRDIKGRHWQSKKTHCPRGHPLIAGNLYGGARGRKSRTCRACALARSRR